MLSSQQKLKISVLSSLFHIILEFLAFAVKIWYS